MSIVAACRACTWLFALLGTNRPYGTRHIKSLHLALPWEVCRGWLVGNFYAASALNSFYRHHRPPLVLNRGLEPRAVWLQNRYSTSWVNPACAACRLHDHCHHLWGIPLPLTQTGCDPAIWRRTEDTNPIAFGDTRFSRPFPHLAGLFCIRMTAYNSQLSNAQVAKLL